MLLKYFKFTVIYIKQLQLLKQKSLKKEKSPAGRDSKGKQILWELIIGGTLEYYSIKHDPKPERATKLKPIDLQIIAVMR